MPLTYEVSDREKENLKRVVDYSEVQSLPEIWTLAAESFGDILALHDPHSKPETKFTYAELATNILKFAIGLQSLGVRGNSKVALFSENSPYWFIADQGIMTAGGVDIVRSSQAEEQELRYIYENSESSALVVENLKTYHKLKSHLENLPVDFVVLLSKEKPETEGVKMFNYQGILAAGENQQLQPVRQNADTLATLLYTSGTTGKPKGVMLSHGNLLHQVQTLGTVIQPQPRDRLLSLLPSWHAYERSAEYFLLSQGVTQIYTNRRYFKEDLRNYHAHYMVGVPRLWEAIHDGAQKKFQKESKLKQQIINFCFGVSEQYLNAQKTSQGLSLDNPATKGLEKLGAKFKAIVLSPLHGIADGIVYKKVREGVGGEIKTVISGGGSLARSIDKFYAVVGIPLIVGYGLTETAPVLNARRPWKNVIGATGQPIAGTQNRIVDPHSRQELPLGEKGLILVRGPQVMQGYYKLPEKTQEVIDPEGWFDTGDLGYIAQDSNLVITGRQKDTIVLNNGENIEPQPIEDACLRSKYINQIIVVGQDQKSLSALIVPDLEIVEKWAQDNKQSIEVNNRESLNSCQPLRDLFRKELDREVKDRPGYSGVDRIGNFVLLSEQFTPENGLMTQTMKMKRPVISEHYRDIIDGMYER